MVNPALQTTGKVASKSIGGIFAFLLKIKWRYVIIIALFVQALIIGIQSGSWIVFAQTLGERFVGIMRTIVETSTMVIQNQGSFTNIFEFLKVAWDLFSSVYVLILWIKLFDTLFGKSPLSNESAGFVNLSLSIITFYLLQVFYLLTTKYAFQYSIMEQYGFFDIFSIPINAIKLLVTALIVIFTSINFDRIPEINLNSSNITNVTTFCSDITNCTI